MKYPRRSVEPVIILRGPQEITIIARIGIECQRGGDIPIRVELQRVVLCDIFRLDDRLDIAKVCRLNRLRIRVDTYIELTQEAWPRNKRQRITIGNLEGLIGIKRTREAALAEICRIDAERRDRRGSNCYGRTV